MVAVVGYGPQKAIDASKHNYSSTNGLGLRHYSNLPNELAPFTVRFPYSFKIGNILVFNKIRAFSGKRTPNTFLGLYCFGLGIFLLLFFYSLLAQADCDTICLVETSYLSYSLFSFFPFPVSCWLMPLSQPVGLQVW